MDFLMLVNKDNLVSESFIPEDLEIVDNNENNFRNMIDPNQKVMINKIVLDRFIIFQRFLESKGIYIIIDSAYRSVVYQKRVYDKLKDLKGEAYAKEFVASPRTSEHHTGLALDYAYFEDGVYDDDITESDLKVQFINSIAHEFGFIVRYPKGKEKITGYSYEPWHLRYVGITHAKEMHNKNLVLEEYLELLKELDIEKQKIK